jgi:peptide chain release factor 2
MADLSAVESDLRSYDEFEQALEDLEVLNGLALDEDDAATADEVAAGIARLRDELAELEILVLLGGEHDQRDAIVTVHAGGRTRTVGPRRRRWTRRVTRWRR